VLGLLSKEGEDVSISWVCTIFVLFLLEMKDTED
jgi:hypothetical protein